jgi:cell division protein FtsL
MTRVSLLLLVATVVSALWLVNSHYDSRRMFMDMESARKEAKRIEVDHDRLEVERRAQATPLRVEQIARQQLNMRTASPAITQYVNALGAPVGALPTPAAGVAQ